MSEKKSSVSCLAALAGSIVAAGAAGAFVYFSGLLGKTATPLSSAALIPDEALMAAYISTDSSQWSKLRRFGTPQAQAAIAQSLDNWQQQLLNGAELNYQQDLQPWVGGVMIALVPPTAPAPNFNPNVLMVVGIKNKLGAWNFGRQLKSSKDVKIEESQYKNVPVTAAIAANGSTSYTAVLNNLMVVADNKTTLEQAIDTAQGEPSFVTKPRVAPLLTKGAEVENPIAHVYIPDYGALVAQSAQTPEIQAVKSAVMSAGVENGGVRVRAIASVDPQGLPLPQTPVSSDIVARFPAETFAFVSGQGLSQIWSTLVEQSRTVPEMQLFLDQIRQSLATVNLNADRDLFRWMNGSFAVGAIASEPGDLTQAGFGAALLFETSDRATAESTLSKIDAIARRQLPFINIDQRTVQGINVTEWQIPTQGALVAHGWRDEKTLFISTGGRLVNEMASQPRNPLNASSTFSAIAGSLPQPNQGYFYLDVEKAFSLWNSAPLVQQQPLQPEVDAALSSTRGIGVTAFWPNPSTTQIEMFIALKPKSNN